VREVPAAIASSSSRLASTVDAGGAGRDTRSPLPSGQVASTLAAEQTRAVDALVVDASQRPIVGLSIEWRRSSEPYWDGNTLHTPTTAIEIPRALRERLLQPRPEEAMDPADWKDEPLVWDLLTKGEVSRAHATSDAQGRIAAQVPVEAVERIVVDPRRTIVAEARDGATGQQIWIVAPTVRLAGIVVDEAGAPIAQTGLSVGPVWDFATPLVGIDVDAIRFLQSPATVTDDQGRFHVDSAPIEPHSVIRVFATGMAETVVQTPDHDELALRSVMKKNPAATLPHVSGLVVGPGGKPVEGAWVECGQDSAQSDASGRFDIELSTTPAERTPLTAVRSGYQAAILADFVKKDMQSVEGVVLRLGGEPLTITGRVVEADGSPIAACHVQLVDGTQAGTSDRTVEELTADDARPEKRTQPNGEFFLGGLQEREYTLMAWHEERGFVARLEHVRAGSKDVELRRDPGAFVEHLSGRLVDTQGTPIEGAQIGIALPLVQARNMTNWYQYGEVVSAAGGAFTLVNVPKSGMSLWVAGEGLAKGTLPMPDLRSPPITVVAAIEVRAHLTVSDPSVTRVRFEDRDGTVVRLKAYRLRTIAGTNVLGRENGAFPAFDVQDSATTAVLMREDGQIVRRAPIAIRRTRLLELDL
jgi:protocatechuate 3,4-dioxygenase beta subunit